MTPHARTRPTIRRARAGWLVAACWLALSSVQDARAQPSTAAGPPALGDGTADTDPGFRCRLKEARGLLETDADTTKRLCCEELRQAGGRGTYDVSLETLGRMVVITVAREKPPMSMTIQAANLEEVPTAAARIGEALARGRPLRSTQRVDNLLEVETREALSKKGRVKFSLGVSHLESLGHGAGGSGFSVGLSYASPRFALPAELRFGWDDEDDYDGSRLELLSLSVGGRAYLSKRDLSPFAGAGLGLLRLDVGQGGYFYDGPSQPESFDGHRNGIAPYLEVGIEMLRLHRGRIALSVRADLPMGAVHSRQIRFTPPDRGGPYDFEVVEAQSRYVVPVTVGASVTF